MLKRCWLRNEEAAPTAPKPKRQHLGQTMEDVFSGDLLSVPVPRLDVPATIANRYPTLRHLFADGGYAGPVLRDALKAIGCWTVQIIKHSDTVEGFEVLPRRRVVEPTFAWLGRCRRLARDREKSIASAEAWRPIAHIRRVTRHRARN